MGRVLVANSAATGIDLSLPLPDELSGCVVAKLKQEVDRHWWVDANESVKLANLIIQIGAVRQDKGQMALGKMALGDSLKLLGKIEEAWASLEEAGQSFLAVQDEVGWARTCIGRLPISVELGYLARALADAQQAREIFLRHGEDERIMRLLLNTAAVYNMLGQHSRALRLFHEALDLANAIGVAGEGHLSQIFNCIGYAYNYLGDFRQAQTYYERAYTKFVEHDEVSGAAVAELNLAYIAQGQGHYRRALRLLHQVLDRVGDKLPVEAALAKRDMVECYLLLNRHREARDLAAQVIEEYRALDAPYETARTLLILATTEAELANFAAARVALDEAKPIFTRLNAASWVAMTQLRSGQVALHQQEYRHALQEAEAAALGLAAGKQLAYHAQALLLQGQALYHLGDNLDAASATSREALRIAQQHSLSELRYSAHLLLGRIAEQQGRTRRAIRRYYAATATVARVQRNLTITLRPSFLEDKSEALRDLIRLQLQQGRTAGAFEALEQAKSQVLFNYLANRERLAWPREDDRIQGLIEELNRLREEHQWFYRQMQAGVNEDSDERAAQLDPQQVRSELAARERRMRALSERLYLYAEDRFVEYGPRLTLADVQATLDASTALVEFYSDGQGWWAFVVDQHQLEVTALPVTVDEVNYLLDQFQFNIDCALKVAPDSTVARNLANIARRISVRLYEALLAPLPGLAAYARLVIVPYSALHYLPFHALYTGQGYLVQRQEVVIQPSAGSHTRKPVARDGSPLILAHSWEQRLPQTQAEADTVQRLIGGETYAEAAAERGLLRRQPGKILHIAAHGEHRIDQPDFSYIQLADGQLMTDDLLQQDLSYELVTLSACETGRARVAPGDELVGIGRGFLYAGAGALLSSLWKIPDTTAAELMTAFYSHLMQGASKAAALRDAQCQMLDQQALLHPAFWGAFQLVGDARPLSST